MKVGRNDPCPCGSGKKYKHCCLRNDEAQAKEAREGAEGPKTYEPGREFADIEESNRFAQGWMESRNSAPVEDFEGLSSAQIDSILRGSLAENEWLVSLSEELPDELALRSEVVGLVRWLLQYFVDHGGKIRLTGRLNYPRALVSRYVREVTAWYREGDSIPLEESLPELVAAHDILLEVGYTDEDERNAWLATEGVAVISSQQWARVYREAFTHMVQEHDWKEWLPEKLQTEHFDLIQNSALFLMYLLKRHPEGTLGEFYDRFTRAFPMFEKPARDDRNVLELLRNTFLALVFDFFFVMFGLVSLDLSNGDEAIQPETRYRTTELFRQAFRWGV